MALETDKFIISGVERLYVESKEIRGDGMRPDSQAVGFQSLNAVCKSCSKTTRVTASGRGLTPVIGGVIVNCPICGNQEHFTGNQLDAAI